MGFKSSNPGTKHTPQCVHICVGGRRTTTKPHGAPGRMTRFMRLFRMWWYSFRGFDARGTGSSLRFLEVPAGSWEAQGTMTSRPLTNDVDRSGLELLETGCHCCLTSDAKTIGCGVPRRKRLGCRRRLIYRNSTSFFNVYSSSKSKKPYLITSPYCS